MRKLFKNWFFPLLILGLTLFIAFRNYTPGTWLLGWDNLVPELNLKLNITRSLSAVWQEYQGLGLLGGMAHAADLPRQLILGVASLILPTSFLRYFWTFLMFLVGPLGVYFLVSRGLIGKKNRFLANLSGFVSAIFYIFNLATVQTFFTPFETFICFYGFFPWLLFFATLFLKNGRKRDLVIFSAISLLATGAFYVQTMFIVYAIFLLIFALEGIIRNGKAGISRSIKLALVTIFINAFWLAPALYFTVTSPQISVGSHINSIATPETQLMNQARSSFSDIATLKGYWFDYYDWDLSGEYDYLYKDWISYGQNLNVDKISIALFVVSAVGLAIILFKSKNAFGVSFIVLLGISYFMLSGGAIPWIPFFSEIFRNVFTKWANAAALIYATGLGFFVYVVSGIIKNKLKYISGVVISGLLIGGSVFTVLPVFQGKLIAQNMKVILPSYYLETVNYFKSQDSTKRIANFPLTDFWGWKFNDWGYRGSGFLWYGVSQPVLDRAFDVWSPYNEQFYDEANYVISWGSVSDLEGVLGKYQVSYLVFDESIFKLGDSSSTTDLQKQKAFLESSSLISKDRTFGKITIYKVNLPEINNFIGAPQINYSEPVYQIGQTGTLVVNETFPENQGYKEAKNCNLDKRGNVVKRKQNGGNYYAADGDGVSCDYFYYPTLDYSKAYAMHISGINLSGRSLRLYLYNVKEEKIYMDELLPEGSFDKTYVVLPTGSSEDLGYGYTLNVETRSFGKMKSENLVSGITFYELNAMRTQPGTVSNNLQIDGVQKYGTWAYKVNLEGSGLLQLGQGYENGWIGFEIKDYRLKVAEHVKVNSWANGWQVQSDSASPITVYLLYWPQILEWGGLALGVIILTWLIIGLY